MDCEPFQEGSSAAINHVRLEARLIHLCRWQHPEADTPEELPGWGKLLPSPEPPPCGVGHGAGLGPAGQGAQGALVPCSIRGTKSINAGEAAAHSPGCSSIPTQGSWCNWGWLRSAPRRPGPTGAGQTGAFPATRAPLQRVLTPRTLLPLCWLPSSPLEKPSPGLLSSAFELSSSHFIHHGCAVPCAQFYSEFFPPLPQILLPFLP